MKKEKKETKKADYKKPILTKHRKLKNVTTAYGSPPPGVLGCTRFF